MEGFFLLVLVLTPVLLVLGLLGWITDKIPDKAICRWIQKNKSNTAACNKWEQKKQVRFGWDNTQQQKIS